MPEYVIDIKDTDLKPSVQGRQRVEMDDDTTIEEALENIIAGLQLPRTTLNGEPRRYLLGYEGQVLGLTDVLSQVVPAGGRIMMTSDATVAGRDLL